MDRVKYAMKSIIMKDWSVMLILVSRNFETKCIIKYKENKL